VNPRLVIWLFACAAVGIGAAAAALIAGWSVLAAMALCSVTASLCLVPAALLAFRARSD
jgi:hypothetical protein